MMDIGLVKVDLSLLKILKPRPSSLGFLLLMDLVKIHIVQNNILFETKSRWEKYVLSELRADRDENDGKSQLRMKGYFV
ncbi:MAG: hypothetical protein CMP48_11425 [Rickettsiales bacterium]|nr:hypothetical protein [Rickettsiales bacterium]